MGYKLAGLFTVGLKAFWKRFTVYLLKSDFTMYTGDFLPVNEIQSRTMWMQGTSNTRYKEGPRASVCSLRAFCAEQ